MKGFKLILVSMLSVLALILFTVDASYGQSVTHTTYSNDLVGITTTHVVADHQGSLNPYRSTYASTGVSYNSSTQTAYNIGYASAKDNYAPINSAVQVDKPIKAEFLYISTAKLNSETDSIVETWSNLNSCTYKVNRSKTKVTFKEFDSAGKSVKEWSYDIDSHVEDCNTWTFYCQGLTVVIWKDKTMVALEQKEYTYLVQGGFHSSSDLLGYD